MDQQDETTFSRTERRILLAVGLVLVVVTVIVVIRVATPEFQPIGSPGDRPTAGADVSLPISVVDAIALASIRASEWKADARFVLVSSQFELSGDEPSVAPATPSADLGWIMVSFVAEKEGDGWPRASIAVGRESGEIYFEEAFSSVAEPPPPLEADLAELPVSAERAFAIAEREAGIAYREGCSPSRRQVQLALDTTDRDDLAWVVVYYDQRHRGDNDIVVRVSAETGETTTDVRGDVACDVAHSYQESSPTRRL